MENSSQVPPETHRFMLYGCRCGALIKQLESVESIIESASCVLYYYDIIPTDLTLDLVCIVSLD